MLWVISAIFTFPFKTSPNQLWNTRTSSGTQFLATSIISVIMLISPFLTASIRMLLPQIEIFYPFYEIKHTLNSIKGYANSLANSSVDIFASLANKASLSEVSPKFSSFELFCICISRG